MQKKPIIGITIGDMNGIGPEIILKSLAQIGHTESIPVIFAPKGVLEFYLKDLSLSMDLHYVKNLESLTSGKINVLDQPVKELKIQPGKLSEQGGTIAMRSIESGIDHALAGNIHALVTAPISKEAVNAAGYQIPGHTEFLAQKTRTPQVLMMLVNKNLRVALVTGHIPVRNISEGITPELIKDKARILFDSLRSDFGIDTPEIAVLGLNPHAGDGGVIGNEEMETIIPAIKQLNDDDINIEGPFPADGFFGQKLYGNYDAVLAMYHDQGLAPFKLLSFGKGVNFTAGLPIIRTSPDHGTAFNIAGKGVADPSSFIQAFELAVTLSKRS